MAPSKYDNGMTQFAPILAHGKVLSWNITNTMYFILSYRSRKLYRFPTNIVQYTWFKPARSGYKTMVQIYLQKDLLRVVSRESLIKVSMGWHWPKQPEPKKTRWGSIFQFPTLNIRCFKIFLDFSSFYGKNGLRLIWAQINHVLSRW